MLLKTPQLNVIAEQVVIFSDLDGTLLDHHSYQFDLALPAIEQLSAHQVPIVLNTSKTCAEVLQIRQQLSLATPFIVENGAAVFIPQGYFAVQPEDCQLVDGFWCKSFCQPRDHWLALLAELAPLFAGKYQGFSQLTIDQLSQLTGLTAEKTALALARYYSEPIQWLADENSKQDFIEVLTAQGAQILQGGRFIHVSGQCDKGQAQQWLLAQYQQEKQLAMVSISLGDSGNDSAMLEAADVAVQIKSPVHGFPKLKRTTNIYQSEAYGPAGWAECINKLMVSNNEQLAISNE